MAATARGTNGPETESHVRGGHTLTADAGTEVVFFSPTFEWQQTLATVKKNREGAALTL